MIQLREAVLDELGRAAFAGLCSPGGVWEQIDEWRRDEFRDAAQAMADRMLDPNRHVYISTRCLHGEHESCGRMQHARGDLSEPHCVGCDSCCACGVCAAAGGHPIMITKEDR